MVNLRHKSSSQTLEEESDKGSHRRDVSTKTAHERKKTSKKRHGREEERDQVERKHESREVVVHVRSNELLRDAVRGAKVPGGVKWQCWHRLSAVGIERALDAADGEEGPSRRVARAGNVGGRGFEEVEFVQGGAVDAACQDGEELEEDAAADEDERQDREDWSCRCHVSYACLV
jgi:hypothetical protein